MSSLLRRLTRSPRRFGPALPLVAIGLFRGLPSWPPQRSRRPWQRPSQKQRLSSETYGLVFSRPAKQLVYNFLGTGGSLPARRHAGWYRRTEAFGNRDGPTLDVGRRTGGVLPHN